MFESLRPDQNTRAYGNCRKPFLFSMKNTCNVAKRVDGNRLRIPLSPDPFMFMTYAFKQENLREALSDTQVNLVHMTGISP